MYVVKICPRYHIRNLYTQIKYDIPKMIINMMYQRNDIPAISFLEIYILRICPRYNFHNLYTQIKYDIPKINIIHLKYDIPQDGIPI